MITLFAGLNQPGSAAFSDKTPPRSILMSRFAPMVPPIQRRHHGRIPLFGTRAQYSSAPRSTRRIVDDDQCAPRLDDLGEAPNPTGPAASPAEIAAHVAFRLSDEAGAALPIDGVVTAR